MNTSASENTTPERRTHAQWAETGTRGVQTLMDDPTLITREEFNQQLTNRCSVPLDQLR